MKISEIIHSLQQRGFVPELFTEPDIEALITQILAGQEELGEIARNLRRIRQGVQEPDYDRLATEIADTVIAMTCALCCATGYPSDVIYEKLTADERRGWKHSGMSQKEFESHLPHASDITPALQ